MQNRKTYGSSSPIPESTSDSKATPLKSLISTSWNLAIADALTLVSVALFIIVLGRLYGSEALGKFSFALAVASIAQTICIAGYDISLPRLVSSHPQQARRVCLAALRIQLFLCCIVLPISVLAALPKDNTTLLCTAILCMDVIPNALAFGFVSALRGLHHAAEAARINALCNVLPMLACALLISLNAPLWTFALCILLGDTGKLLWLRKRFALRNTEAIYLRELFELAPLFNREQLLRAWKEQRAISLTNLYSTLLVRMPSVMLGWFAGDSHIGMYSAASRFFTALRIVPGAVLHTIIPRYSSKEDNLPRIRTVFALSVLCAATISLALYFSAEHIMRLSFRFEESVPILQILSLAFAALFLKTTLEAFLLAAHREHFINKVLVVVSIAAVGGYWYAAQNSPSHIAWVVAAAEATLALVFFASFVVMRFQQSPSRLTADEL